MSSKRRAEDAAEREKWGWEYGGEELGTSIIAKDGWGGRADEQDGLQRGSMIAETSRRRMEVMEAFSLV